MPRPKCIIILSEKSSGSSACQNLLSKFAIVQHVSSTRHFENETLYWTKAASILGLHQEKMLDSEVPIPPDAAKADLLELLKDNLDSYTQPFDNRTLIFDGWRLLCEHFAPVFLEKSPHHLFQWSALQLILECMRTLDSIDFLLIGLVRNPMDTIYSQFKRWRTRPEQLQFQWATAYLNLLRLADEVGGRLVIIRYEDMVASLDYLKPVFDFCAVQIDSADQEYLHERSILKWKADRLFGFKLAKEVADLAGKYGYSDFELSNASIPLWPAYREVSRLGYRAALGLRGVTRSFLSNSD